MKKLLMIGLFLFTSLVHAERSTLPRPDYTSEDISELKKGVKLGEIGDLKVKIVRVKQYGNTLKIRTINHNWNGWESGGIISIKNFTNSASNRPITKFKVFQKDDSIEIHFYVYLENETALFRVGSVVLNRMNMAKVQNYELPIVRELGKSVSFTYKSSENRKRYGSYTLYYLGGRAVQLRTWSINSDVFVKVVHKPRNSGYDLITNTKDGFDENGHAILRDEVWLEEMRQLWLSYGFADFAFQQYD